MRWAWVMYPDSIQGVCMRCQEIVTCNVHPIPNDAQIAGSAVAVNCTGKKKPAIVAVPSIPRTQYEPPTDLIELADQLLDASQRRHTDRQSEETFVECLACGKWEEHADDCFVPKLKAWIEAPR